MKFVILGHLMEEKDLQRIFPLGKYLPLRVIEGLASLVPAKKSFKKASHFHIFDKAEGWMLGLFLTPQQMIGLPKQKVRKKILEAVLFAQNELKAGLLMLGALTSPLTSAGVWLTEQPGIKLNITNGNTYTAAISIEATEKASQLAGFDFSKIKMAIVGATGAIGEPITRYFNQKGVDLILVARSQEKFERLRPQLQGSDYRFTSNLNEIAEADLIVTATSHPTAIIGPDVLKKNAIVIDVAEPPDVLPSVPKTRPDVTCVDGGRVKMEGVDLGMNLGLPQGTGFACMAEVILQALEQRKENYVGSVDMNHLQETKQWAKKWGFELAPFTCFNKPIPLEKFKKIKNI